MAEKICGIYKITNKVNGKVYIGQSINIHERWRRHKLLGTSNNVTSPERDYPLYVAMRKYGIENFVFEILLTCTAEELNEKEESYIRAYECDSSKYGYNCRKQFHSTGKLTEEDMSKIYYMLSSTSLNMSEIAAEIQVATNVISKINQGKFHFDASRDYPVRSSEQTKKLYSIIAASKTNNDFAIDIRRNRKIDDLHECLLASRSKEVGSSTRIATLDATMLENIFHLLKNTALTFKEIAEKCNVSYATITNINRGEIYAADVEYPIRDRILMRFINHIAKSLDYQDVSHCELSPNELVNMFPDIYKNFKSEFSGHMHNRYCISCNNPISASSKSGLCRLCYSRKVKSEQGLPESDINFSLIERILDTSMENVAREYGYTSGNAVKKLMKSHNLPTSRADMFDYYEKQTGHMHPSLIQKEQQRDSTRKNKKKHAPRRVAQYNKEGELVAVYPSTKEASRQTGAANSSISRCCNGTQVHVQGFVWRYLDYNDNPIAPIDLLTFCWHTTCDICGGDTDSFVAEICPKCAATQQVFNRDNITLEQLVDFLHEYPIAQLLKLCSCDRKTLLSWFARFGVSEQEVKRLNRER